MCSFHLKSVRLEERSPCRHNKPWFLSLILCLGLWPRGSYLRSQNGRHIWIPQVCWCTQSHGGRGKLHIRLCPGCKAFQNIRGHSYTGNWKCIKRTFLAKSSVWLHNWQTKPCHNLHGEFLRKLTDREKSDRQQKIWSVCVNHDFGCCYHWTEWLTSWFGFKYPVTCLIGEDLASSVALWVSRRIYSHFNRTFCFSLWFFCWIVSFKKFSFSSKFCTRCSDGLGTVCL